MCFFIITMSLMSTLDITPSTRKFIRLEKARIRRQFFDVKKQDELIDGLYKKFLNKPEDGKTIPVKEESKVKEVKPVATQKPKAAAKVKPTKAKRPVSKA